MAEMLKNLSTVGPEVQTIMRRQNLMIVDNEETVAAALRNSAAMLGIRDIRSFSDPYSALEVFVCGRQPTIVFVNGNGNRHDALSFCRFVRDRGSFPNPYLPLIMVSSNATREAVLKARDAGVDEFLVCPFSSKTLYERIHSVLFDRRGFVDVQGYFGPDRRRGTMARWLGADRRGGQSDLIEPYTGKVYIG